MKFIYGRQDFKTFERGEENCYLMTNGLGGFSALSMIGSCSRNDHAVLMGCKAGEAPNHRYNMIHRLEEILYIGQRELVISSQNFTDQKKRENGYQNLNTFTYEDYPEWTYLADGVEITKRLALMPGENAVGITYILDNHSGDDITFLMRPQLEFVSKGGLLETTQVFSFYAEGKECRIASEGLTLYGKTNGKICPEPGVFSDDLYYAYDACDGRRDRGCTFSNHSITFRVPAGQRVCTETVYGMEPVHCTADEIRQKLVLSRKRLIRKTGYKNETAKALVKAAAQFVSYRATTKKQTILAGFPFFEDWGRDTMISIVGCCLSAGQYKTATEILRTFMKYCKNGLMPNLFPEGGHDPGYNTVDAALLFIIAVYEYYIRTGKLTFVREAYPVMEEIVSYYEKGTDYNIGMDTDGLIHAGKDYDQVTWMDVRVGDILPTPRHGKPVEINAYWYNALRIMDLFQTEFCLGEKKDYAVMAERTKISFEKLFWSEEMSCLKDVVSGTKADGQIRCNQIWAVSLPYSILDREKERKVVETVFRYLYTPLGLRTLSPSDPEFHPIYAGEMIKRDLAYHQGTVWTFPLGGYYLAYLKVHDYNKEAKTRVRMQLEGITAALREGCVGQLPEIYDGLKPASSKGCFAQAWSVGEILRVYEILERGTR